MAVQNSTRLTRSSPAEVKKNDVFFAAVAQQLSDKKGLEDPAGSLGPGPGSNVRNLVLDFDHRDQGKHPERAPKAKSHVSSKSKPKSKRPQKVSKPEAKRAVGSHKPRKQELEKLSQILTRAEERGGNFQECVICVEKKGRRRFPNLTAPLGCGHGLDACYDCLLRFVTASLQAHGQWDRISCIECKDTLTQEDIKGILTSKDFAKLETLVEQKAIEANPRFRSCLSARCDHGQIHTNLHDNCVKCEACGATSCFVHGVPWHKGYTCDAYDTTHPDAVSLMTSEERIERTAKRCPGKGCKYYIEKDGGCDHMYCSNCKEGWDWRSGKLDRDLHPNGIFGNLNAAIN